MTTNFTVCVAHTHKNTGKSREREMCVEEVEISDVTYKHRECAGACVICVYY